MTRLLGRKLFAFGFPMALALVVRLVGIASRPIWYDEAFSILFSEKGLSSILVGTVSTMGAGAAEEHPLLYYVLLWAWMHVFGESVIAVRALSIVAGMLLVLVICYVAFSLFGRRTAVAAGVIAAFSPFQVHYAQEIRMYVFLALWLSLATYAYWRASHGRGPKWWLAFAGFAALAQHTHNLAAFYLLALALWPLLRRDWRTAKWVLLAGLVALILYLPWLVHLPSQFAKVDQHYWVDRPALYQLLTLLLYFVPNLPLPGFQLAVGLLISVFVVVIALVQTVKAIRTHQPDAGRAVWLLYLSFFPALLLFALSQWIPIYVERALLPSGAIFCAWLAWAMLETRLPRAVGSVIIVFLAIGFGLGLYNHVAYSGFPYAPYASLDKALSSSLQPGDTIVHSSKLSMLPSVYFDRTLPQTYLADPPGSPQDTLAPATQEVLGLRGQPDLPTAVGAARRVWFIIFDQSLQEYTDAGYPAHPQISWLREHFTSVEEQRYGELHLYLFSKAP